MDNNLEGKTACVHSCKKIEVPTEEEVCVLNELRCIKERVRELKKKISDLSAGIVGGTRDDLMDLEKEMADLKEEWLSWEEKRQQAAKERMIILGHEEPAAK
jgi:predicted nuclease with TOPRIM domain